MSQSKTWHASLSATKEGWKTVIGLEEYCTLYIQTQCTVLRPKHFSVNSEWLVPTAPVFGPRWVFTSWSHIQTNKHSQHATASFELQEPATTPPPFTHPPSLEFGLIHKPPVFAFTKVYYWILEPNPGNFFFIRDAPRVKILEIRVHPTLNASSLIHFNSPLSISTVIKESQTLQRGEKKQSGTHPDALFFSKWTVNIFNLSMSRSAPMYCNSTQLS